MKIQEITEGLKWELSTNDFRSIVDHMGKTMQSVGWGGYSEVFQHPQRNDIVIKIFSEDRGYAKYFLWMTKHQNNRYVPKIIPYDDNSIIRLYRYKSKNYKNKIQSRKMGIIQLRKLEKLSRYRFSKFKKYISSFMDKDIQSEILDRASVYLGNDFLCSFKPYAWENISKNSRTSDADLSEIAAYFAMMNNKYGSLDIHDENLMWDPVANNVVFIDILSLN